MKDFFKMLKRGEVDVRRELDVEFLNEEGIDASGLANQGIPQSTDDWYGKWDRRSCFV